MSQQPKPYPEVIVFVILILMAIALFMFVTWRDHTGIENYCNNNPSHCSSNEIPGKVVK